MLTSLSFCFKPNSFLSLSSNRCLALSRGFATAKSQEQQPQKQQTESEPQQPQKLTKKIDLSPSLFQLFPFHYYSLNH